MWLILSILTVVRAQFEYDDPDLLRGDYYTQEGSTPAHLPQMLDIEFEEIFPKGDIASLTKIFLHNFPK